MAGVFNQVQSIISESKKKRLESTHMRSSTYGASQSMRPATRRLSASLGLDHQITASLGLDELLESCERSRCLPEGPEEGPRLRRAVTEASQAFEAELQAPEISLRDEIVWRLAELQAFLLASLDRPSFGQRPGAAEGAASEPDWTRAEPLGRSAHLRSISVEEVEPVLVASELKVGANTIGRASEETTGEETSVCALAEVSKSAGSESYDSQGSAGGKTKADTSSDSHGHAAGSTGRLRRLRTSGGSALSGASGCGSELSVRPQVSFPRLLCSGSDDPNRMSFASGLNVSGLSSTRSFMTNDSRPEPFSPGQSHQRRLARLRSVVLIQDASARGRNSGFVTLSQWLRRKLAPVVEMLCSLIVLINCVTIGLSMDVSPEWVGWTMIDGVFSAVFAIELLFKVAVHRSAWFFSNERWWNIFEASLVVGSFVELSAMLLISNTTFNDWSILRILRVVRITRIFRLCRLPCFMELMIMVQSALGGVRTLGWATVLISMPLYAASIFYRGTLGELGREGDGAEGFSSVPTSFFTLFSCIVAQECTDTKGRPIFKVVAEHHGWGYSFAYCLLVLGMCMGLFNVVIGLFIERVLVGARYNAGLIEQDRLRDQKYFAAKMVRISRHLLRIKFDLDPDEVNRFSNQEVLEACAKETFETDVLERTFADPDVRALLKELSIAQEDTLHIARVVQINGVNNAGLAEIFEAISDLRGNPCRSDLVRINTTLEQLFEQFRAQAELTMVLHMRLSRTQAQILQGRTGHECII